MNIDQLLAEVKANKKTPDQLLQEIKEINDGRKYGRKGKDADEEAIVERVLSIVLKQIPEPIPGKDGEDAVVDYDKIIKSVIRKIPKPKKGKDGKNAVVDYTTIFEKVKEEVSKIELPTIDYEKMAIDAINLLETFEGDERLDVGAIKNLDKVINKLIKESEKNNIKFTLEQLELLRKEMPKLPTEYAQGSGATFLKSMRDVDLTGIQDGYGIFWDASQQKFTVGEGGGSAFFPEHLDGGNIADTPADIVEPTISFNGGNQDDNLTANWKFITGTISDNTALQAELDAKQDNITVSDTAEIDMTFAGNDISASIVASSIDETKLDASVNASLDLADSASQPGHTHTASDVTDFDTEVSNNTDVAANTTHRTSDGTDHTFIDQDVRTTASPTFTGITNDGDEHEQINTTAKTGNYTVASGDRNILCDTSGGAFTLTLPATPTAGRVVSVLLDVAGNDLTIAGNGKNINGEATKLLGTVGGVNFIYNGTQWNIK